jgi:hypothetical protein
MSAGIGRVYKRSSSIYILVKTKVPGDGTSNLGHPFVAASSKVDVLEKGVQGSAAVGFLLHVICLALYMPIGNTMFSACVRSSSS